MKHRARRGGRDGRGECHGDGDGEQSGDVSARGVLPEGTGVEQRGGGKGSVLNGA